MSLRLPSQASDIVPERLSTYLKLLATMLFWGGTWIAGRVVVQEVAPLAAATWRFLLATAALGALTFATEGRIPALDRGQWKTVLLLGVTGIFAYNLFFLYGLKHVSAGRGALVVALNPAVVALVAWLAFRDSMTPVKAVGIVMAMFGCLLVISNGSPAALLRGEVGLGEWLIIGCVLCWTAYTFIGRRATLSLSPLTATFYAAATGCAMLAAAALLEGSLLARPDYSPRAWGAIVFLGLFGTALGFTWYADGVKRIGPARAAAFINLVPVAAVLLGALLLGERLGAGVLAGGALVLAGVVMTNASARQPPRLAREAP